MPAGGFVQADEILTREDRRPPAEIVFTLGLEEVAPGLIPAEIATVADAVAAQAKKMRNIAGAGSVTPLHVPARAPRISM